jgi:glucose/arabinose dehydrogenase
MRSRLILLLVVTAALSIFASPAQGEDLVEVAPGSWGSSPIHLTAPLNDTRVFVAERDGVIRIVENGVVRATPFLTISGVDTAGERGLMSIAFAPDYASSGLFYAFVSLSGAPDTLNVLQYSVSGDPNVANPTATPILSIDHTGATNHNGGQLVFARDGNLFITIGEFSNTSNSQTLTNLLGKVLRINPRVPSALGNYSAPADNPFVGTAGARPEIFALGFRNPYRASIAPGDRLVVGDVGGGSWEEVNIVAKGANHGWPICEGNCSPTNPALADPYFAYPHPASAQPKSVIGGIVVRDTTLTNLYGRYLFSDLGNNYPMSSLSLDGNQTPTPTGISADFTISYGEDARGCAYVLASGTVYRITPGAGPAACPLSGFVPPAGTPLPVSQIPTPNATLNLSSNRLRMRRNKIKVKLRCTSTVACPGRVSITTASKVRLRKGAKRRTALIASRRIPTVQPGRSITVTLLVRRGVRGYLKKRSSLRVRVAAGPVGAPSFAIARLRTR